MPEGVESQLHGFSLHRPENLDLINSVAFLGEIFVFKDCQFVQHEDEGMRKHFLSQPRAFPRLGELSSVRRLLCKT